MDKNTLLLRCPYGHDSEYQSKVSDEKPYVTMNDVRSFKVETVVTCKECGRSFQSERLRTVYYFDDRPVDQSADQTDFREIGGSWNGKLELVEIKHAKQSKVSK